MIDAMITINTDLERLEAVVTQMQARNPDLTVDDCCDAIFALGMIALGASITLTEKSQ